MLLFANTLACFRRITLTVWLWLKAVFLSAYFSEPPPELPVTAATEPSPRCAVDIDVLDDGALITRPS